jgi:hypothetical protein
MLVVAKMTSQKSLPNTGIACYSYAPKCIGSALGSKICGIQTIVFYGKIKIVGIPKSLPNKILRNFCKSPHQEKTNHG